MNQRRMIVACLLAVVVFGLGCQKKAAEEIDYGKVESSVYRNNYFGMSVTLPSDWSVQDEAAREELAKAGGEMIAGDDKNLKAAVKASELTSLNLFAVFQHPLGAPVDFNPNIICVAEQVRNSPGIKTGEDYLFHAKKLLQSGQMEVAFPADVYATTIGGKEFHVMSVDMSMSGATVSQKYYTAVMKGYALSFIVSYTTAEDEAALESILKTVTFS